MIDVEPMIISELERMVPLPDRSRADWAGVLRRAGLAESSFRWRRLVVAVLIVAALAVPALALSGVLDPLFGVSNQGTPIPSSDLSHVSAIIDEVGQLTGAPPGTVVQLASRNGWTFYAAGAANGDVCYFDEAPPGSESDGIPNPPGLGGGSCKDAAGEADFPSPARPVFNMSHYLNGPPDMSVIVLAGVAADGVASVQVLALSDCRVVATAPVVDNVYIADNLPLLPEAEIVARDAAGNPVWHQAVDAGIDFIQSEDGTVERPPKETSCGLG